MRANWYLVVKLCLSGLASMFLITSCNRTSPGGNSRDLSLSDFDFLRIGMSYQEVVAQVGEADRDAGSGIHLMLYELQEGTELVLSFPSLDSLSAAYLYNPETDTREPILGPGY
ncbi:MAG: hypothetical protein ACRDHG_05640 [Anaerolineales bacterium]